MADYSWSDADETDEAVLTITLDSRCELDERVLRGAFAPPDSVIRYVDRSRNGRVLKFHYSPNGTTAADFGMLAYGVLMYFKIHGNIDRMPNHP